MFVYSKEGPKVDTQNFTVLIKNSISFPQLDKNYRVLVKTMTLYPFLLLFIH